MKKIAEFLNKLYQKKISPYFRVLPNFIIIGTMKGGTSSLYQYLTQHPDIYPASRKEIHYFDSHYAEGLMWYKSCFPEKKKMHPGQITGEASPFYLAHPSVPERIKEILPDIRLVVLLRNPTERAYSHYQHNLRLKRESLSFKDALDMEEERIQREIQKMLDNPNYNSYNYPLYSYKTRGRYIEQLQRWFKYFPREQFIIIKSEDFFKHPDEITSKVSGFLGLKPCQGIEYKKHNFFGEYLNMPDDIRKQLIEYFEPYNKQLYDLLNVNYAWK